MGFRLEAGLFCQCARLCSRCGWAACESNALGLTIAWLPGAGLLVNEPVQLLNQLRHVRCFAPFGQPLVYSLGVVVALGIGERRRLHLQCLEAAEHLSSEDLEPAFDLIAGSDGLDSALQSFETRETRRAQQRCRVEAEDGYRVLMVTICGIATSQLSVSRR